METGLVTSAFNTVSSWTLESAYSLYRTREVREWGLGGGGDTCSATVHGVALCFQIGLISLSFIAECTYTDTDEKKT